MKVSVLRRDFDTWPYYFTIHAGSFLGVVRFLLEKLDSHS